MLCIYFFCLVQSLPRGEHVLNFSDAEELINDAELTEAQDEALEQELAVADRCVSRCRTPIFP
jgi:microspherule protein 1